MKNFKLVFAVTAAPLTLALGACGEPAEPDERVVDETSYDSPADIEVPDTSVETPVADTDGVPANDATATPEQMSEAETEIDGHSSSEQN